MEFPGFFRFKYNCAQLREVDQEFIKIIRKFVAVGKDGVLEHGIRKSGKQVKLVTEGLLF